MDEIRRGPGRPKYQEVVGEAQTAAVATDPIAPRAARKPFGTLEQKLAYPARENFHRHWFNDIPGRVPRALEAGYEHVKDEAGKNVCRVVGTAEAGGALMAYLMEIPEELFKQDMAAQQRVVDEKEAAMAKGELESQPGDKRYVPGQGISIRHG